MYIPVTLFFCCFSAYSWAYNNSPFALDIDQSTLCCCYPMKMTPKSKKWLRYGPKVTERGITSLPPLAARVVVMFSKSTGFDEEASSMILGIPVVIVIIIIIIVATDLVLSYHIPQTSEVVIPIFPVAERQRSLQYICSIVAVTTDTRLFAATTLSQRERERSHGQVRRR